MPSTSLDVPAYLLRIGCGSPPQPTVEALAELHLRHLLTVPFENLDIHMGRPLSLKTRALEDKIVRRRRGGFCYELNGLFAELLSALGYKVSLVSARVFDAEGRPGPVNDHLALTVACEGLWLVDVGFGDAFIEPLDLNTDAGQHQRGVEHRLQDGVYSSRQAGGEYVKQYALTLEPRRLEDFEAMCKYHQTSASSHFTQKVVCSLLTERGRRTVRRREVIETKDGTRSSRGLASDAKWKAALQECGIRL